MHRATFPVAAEGPKTRRGGAPFARALNCRAQKRRRRLPKIYTPGLLERNVLRILRTNCGQRNG